MIRTNHLKKPIRGLAIAAITACLMLANCGPNANEQDPASAAITTPAVGPANIGECIETTVVSVGPRLEGLPDSGSSVLYANGMTQVSYDVLPSVNNSGTGDTVRLCLVSVPENCPPGDDRGRVYTATNLRTNETWTAPDSQHMCGGA